MHGVPVARNVPANGDALVVKPNVNLYHPAIGKCYLSICVVYLHLIIRCFCHRITDPSPTRLVTPHSCAHPCSRVRISACGHGCPLPCHPGPCPPCAVTVRKGCWCGRQVSTVRCSSLASPNATTGVSCGVICSKPLLCGNPQHTCAQVCHPGECKPCVVAEIVACYCGNEEKEVPCGDRKNWAVVCAVEGELGWEGRYECDGVCGRQVFIHLHLAYCLWRVFDGGSCMMQRMYSYSLFTITYLLQPIKEIFTSF